MCAPHLQHPAGPRLDHTQFLVLAGRGQHAAVGVEGHAEDDVRVAVNHLHRLADLQVPDEDLGEWKRRGGAGRCFMGQFISQCL